MDVTLEDLKNYVRAYLDALDATALAHLPIEDVGALRSVSLLLLLTVRVYLSPGFGVAFEFQHAAANEEVMLISAVEGSGPIEDVLFGSPEGYKHLQTVMPGKAGAGVVLADCGFNHVYPVRLAGRDSTVRLIEVDLSFESWKRHIHYAELHGDSSAEKWTTTSALARALQEVLVAVTDASRAKKMGLSLSAYLLSVKAKTVLVLGDYKGDGAQRLSAICERLKQLDYQPVLVSEVDDFPAQSLSQKVTMIGGMCRFVIMDDSSPAGHMVELPIAQSNEWIMAIIRLDGKGGSVMTVGASITSNVISEFAYSNETLALTVEQAVQWAEETNTGLGRKFDQIYGWRKEVTK